ncbi:molybdopterin molybdotransferase MoeA [Maridesulfovibrio zosterae]|uniref:molybdopterin molybdotransferase MoeA n=1 Tax=Maridesulfovibrio zosterae TaxID=82171 RepID=UPI0004819494|nr:molybdopterin molybdotransferase MoeA [Maridesulfovibrio zosterae]
MPSNQSFSKNIPRSQALRTLQDRIRTLPEEQVSVIDCSDKISAQTICSAISLPEHDRSAMDGFAVSSTETTKASKNTPIVLSFTGEIRPSSMTPSESTIGSAVKVLTGGIIPPGTDAVIPFEKVVISENTIQISSPVKKGDYIFKRGSDIKKGETIISENEIINPCQAALLSYAGIRAVPVRCSPAIAVLAVGNELCDPAAVNSLSLIPADNLILVKSLCKRCGATEIKISPCANSPESISTAIKAYSHCNLIITTGGTGPGNRDFVFNSVLEAGGTPIFKGLSMHPAKSIFACQLGSCIVVGLPGPPNAVNLAFHTVIKPIINILLGQPDISPKFTAHLSSSVIGANEREKLRPCLVFEQGGKLIADPLTSPDLSPRKVMNISNGIIVLPPDCGELEKGCKVQVIKFA